MYVMCILKFARFFKKNYQDFFSGLKPTAGVSIYVIRLDIIFLVGCMAEYLKLHARNFNFFKQFM